MPMIVALFTFVGFGVGVSFSVVMAAALLSGAEIPVASGPPPSVIEMAATYIVGGSVGGLTVGLARRFLVSIAGGAVLGMIFMLPMTLGSGVMYYGSWETIRWDTVAIALVVIGIPMGLFIRREYHELLSDVSEAVKPGDADRSHDYPD